MNSTFKVVFNKARGALMVVNEVTSSVQAKGTKTVVATAVAAMIAGVAGTAMAAEPVISVSNTAVAIKGDALIGELPKANGTATYDKTTGIITINATGFESAKYGVFSNMYKSDRTDIYGAAAEIGNSTFTSNKSANAGGALTLWQDGGSGTQPLNHLVKNSTFIGNKALNKGGAVAIMKAHTAITGGIGATTFEKVTFTLKVG